MDILTKKGRLTRRQEMRAIDLFLAAYDGAYDVVETPKDEPSRIDGFVVDEMGSLVYGVEVKCRNLTLRDLNDKYNNEWLVTAEKINEAVGICSDLCIGLRGFLYLVPEDVLLIVPIWDYKKGAFVANISLRDTETQKTVNGGSIVRLNAFIDVSQATQIP